MQIYIKNEASYRPHGLFGGNLPLTVESTDTVESVKRKILDLSGVPFEQQRLILNGDMSTNPALTPLDSLRWTQFRWKQLLDAPQKRLELEDSRALKDYNIEGETTLILVDTSK
eukprot:gene17444-20767_t